MSLLQTPPLSLYIHIPWCVRKCPYCDFNSHEAGARIDEAGYVAALMDDLDQELALHGPRELQSIFFGGGTPSLLSAASIDGILSGVTARMTLADDAEITLEANPGTVEQQKFSDYRAAGVNRLSIGVQTFDDDKLRRLGRIHDRSEAVKAIEAAHAAGFDNFNLDLMFGLPGQDVKQAISDMTLACELQPAHISHYQLTIEPNTFFHKHRPALPDTDLIWEMQQHCHAILNRRGYLQYEVSAFARSGKECRHNLNYWQFGDYLGIGAGAHGKISNAAGNTVERRWKHRQPGDYIARTARGESCSGTSMLDPRDLLFEFLLNALRLRHGFTYELFEERTGIDREQLLEASSPLDTDLLVITDEGVKTSQRGFDFLNDVLEQFLVTAG